MGYLLLFVKYVQEIHEMIGKYLHKPVEKRLKNGGVVLQYRVKDYESEVKL